MSNGWDSLVSENILNDPQYFTALSKKKCFISSLTKNLHLKSKSLFYFNLRLIECK